MDGGPAWVGTARRSERPASRWRRKQARDAAHLAGLTLGALALASTLWAGRCLLAGAPAASGRASRSRGVLRLATKEEGDGNAYSEDSTQAEFKPVVIKDFAASDPRIPNFAVWIMPRKKAAQQFLDWADEEGATEEMADYLRDLAEKEVPKDWGVWALADSTGLDSGGGFYMVPPRSPQVIVQLDAVDQDQSYVEFIAFSPEQLSSTSRRVFQDWIESFRPKRQIIRRPEQLSLWDIEVMGGKGSMATISKGV